jgi:hypothetical protein
LHLPLFESLALAVLSRVPLVQPGSSEGTVLGSGEIDHLERPDWRLAQRRDNKCAAGAKRCCVSKGQKRKVGFVRIAVIERSKMLRTCSNVRFGEVAPQRRELA